MDREASALHLLTERRVDGLLVLACAGRDAANARSSQQPDAESAADAAPHWIQGAIRRHRQYPEAARLAMWHLKELGHHLISRMSRQGTLVAAIPRGFAAIATELAGAEFVVSGAADDRGRPTRLRRRSVARQSAADCGVFA